MNNQPDSKTLSRLCPSCGKILTYSCKQSFCAAKKRNSICKQCFYTSKIGSKMPEWVKEKISASMMGINNPFFGQHHRVLNYFVDAHNKKRNIVVEYDEHHHYDIYGKLKSKDRIRMENIIRCLNCQFYRYNESTKEFYESTENYEVIHS